MISVYVHHFYLKLLMRQNRMLTEQLNVFKTVGNEQPNQFYVIPDFIKSINCFTGHKTEQVQSLPDKLRRRRRRFSVSVAQTSCCQCGAKVTQLATTRAVPSSNPAQCKKFSAEFTVLSLPFWLPYTA